VNEGRLNGLGIFHFHQIAAWGSEQAKWVNAHLSFPGCIQREDWLGQAKTLATDGVTEFAARVDTGDVTYGAEGANYGSTDVDRGPRKD
jgi:branched-chain amino acid transport system ATP-binding protein